MDTVEQQINQIIEATTQDIDIHASNSNNAILHNEHNEHVEEQEQEQQSEDSKFDNIEVFNTALHQYLKINEEIKALLEAIKERNKAKNQISQTLRIYLDTNNIKTVSLGGSYKGKRIENDISYTTTGFSKRSVAEALQEELKDDDEMFSRVMQAISSRTVTKEIHKLKLINDKKPKKTINNISKANSKIQEAEELLGDD